MDRLALRLLVGREIRRRRESQGLTLQVLADMVGTSYTHIWKVENGKVSVGLDLLGRIASALDVPLRELVDPALVDDETLTVVSFKE
ncbi:MAG: helix-turn-helix transcriptional regulator [Atopobiaceae bacterium]|nr:helix-turn-helix transcriptional regulator [Atopobiaceae bacterium]